MRSGEGVTKPSSGAAASRAFRKAPGRVVILALRRVIEKKTNVGSSSRLLNLHAPGGQRRPSGVGRSRKDVPGF